ncbi:hypothetical protein AVEN_260486-1 [Araneus ventricosus]|uniref:CCHC-type domain-containing protein n=1 Tax=Araneus ventricosus TaxID=182803 RepID=A0A4Y2LPV7_ARAVE|nr:hypothetical protein AVEN_260486-1 [Araneus ventricosus]
MKNYEKLFNTSITFRPNNDKTFGDPTHAAKFERKRTPNPQLVYYSCGLKGHKSTQCTNKPHGKQFYGCKKFGQCHANCPQNSRNSASKSDSKLATPARSVNQISAQNVSQNLKHVDITLHFSINSTFLTLVHKPPSLMRKPICELVHHHCIPPK